VAKACISSKRIRIFFKERVPKGGLDVNREEIRARFREENPEITDRVITDPVLYSWCIVGDQEICARARLIVSDDSFDAVEDEDSYNLTSELDKFFDIDEIPGGGVAYVDTSDKEKRIYPKSIAELDDMSRSWRTANSGTPKYYYRRGRFLKTYPAPDDTISSFHVYFVAISDPFDDDNKTPYNQLTHLEPFHYGVVKYLTWRAKSKIGKREDAATAMAEYMDYIKWIKKEVGGGKNSAIYLRPTR